MSPGPADIGEDVGELLIVEGAHRGHQQLPLQAMQNDSDQLIFLPEHPRRVSQWCAKPRHPAAIRLMTGRTICQKRGPASFVGGRSAGSRSILRDCQDVDRIPMAKPRGHFEKSTGMRLIGPPFVDHG